MTKKRIRIGQIGIGHNHGADKMIALRALTDDFEVIGVTENDPVWYEKRKNLPAYRDLPFLSEDELLSNVDAVTVETDGFELVQIISLTDALSGNTVALKLTLDLAGVSVTDD